MVETREYLRPACQLAVSRLREEEVEPLRLQLVALLLLLPLLRLLLLGVFDRGRSSRDQGRRSGARGDWPSARQAALG